MSSYAADSPTSGPEAAPAPEAAPPSGPAPAPKPKKSKAGPRAMSEKQKSDLKKHMDKLKDGGMSATDVKSHRMKMMVRMKRGMSVSAAHSDIGKK